MRENLSGDGPAARKVLAVSSSGGHWVQLQRLVSAFDDCDVIFATTEPGYAVEIAPRRLHVVRDATRWDRLGCFVLLFQMARLVLRERPEVVITTGAAPGCFAVIFGRLFGARTRRSKGSWPPTVTKIKRPLLRTRAHPLLRRAKATA